MSNPFKNWGLLDVEIHNRRTREQAVRNCDIHKLSAECAASRHTLQTLAGNPPDLFRESQLHQQIMEFCASKGWLFFRGSMAHRTRRQPGEPDFCVVMDGGRAVFIEAKRPGSKPTPAQAATIAWLKKLGASAAIVHSMEEFLDAIKQPETKP